MTHIDDVTKRDAEILRLAAEGVGALSIAVRLNSTHAIVVRVIADARARDRGVPTTRPRSAPHTR